MGSVVQLLDAIQAPGPLDPVEVHSSLDGPIESLSFLEKSLLFAELSELSYLSRAEAGRLCNEIGLPEIRFYDREGAQAYIFGNDTDVVVTCRGTEPNDWNDIRADLSLGKVMAEACVMLGADVIIWGRRGNVIADTAKELTDAHGAIAGGRCIGQACDIRVPEAIHASADARMRPVIGIVQRRRQHRDIAGDLAEAEILHQHLAELVQRGLLVLAVHRRARIDHIA